jgi:uncharacterized iron-regulated protein
MNNLLLPFSTHLVSLLLACSFSGLLTGCLSSSNKPELTLWQHELVGKIWDLNQQAFIDKEALLERVSSTEYLLLGERHDNPVHHKHQTWFIQQLKSRQTKASVAFEMIDNYQANRLDEKPVSSADQMIEVLNQFEVNWQYESRYHGLFTEVIAAGYRIDAANLNSERLMHLIMQGEDKLPDAYKRMLGEVQMSKVQLGKMQEEIKTSHCQMLDDSMTNNMVLGQRLRDAIMAHSLLRSQSPFKVLIAGGGHVRNDRGVPSYLGDNSKVLSIGFIEVESGGGEVNSYAHYWGTSTLPFDIIWFTPQVIREDMCEKIRQHLKDKSSDSESN